MLMIHFVCTPKGLYVVTHVKSPLIDVEKILLEKTLCKSGLFSFRIFVSTAFPQNFMNPTIKMARVMFDV